LHVQGWKLNAYDYDGRTALHVAASEGRLDVVVYMVVHGANIHHRDCRNNDALADAMREGHTDVVEFLQSRIGNK
jgi:glutaminase